MLTKVLGQALRGFLMGAADIVPGVSGGTIALVLGIYHRLIENVQLGARALGALVRLDVRTAIERLRAVEWVFLVPLGAGIGVAVISLASVIEHLLDTEPVAMAGLFFGLVVGSIVVAARLVDGWDPARGAVLVGTAVVAFVVLGLRQGPVADPPLWLYLAVGAIAICAMILPGISGSFILLMLGMYDNVLAAVTDRDVLTLAVFLVGAVVGLALFSQLLHWSLVNHERTVLAVLIGLMAGSLRVLWPWPSGTGGTDLAAPSGSVALPVALAVVGVVVVLGVTWIAQRLEGRADEDLVEELERR